MSVEPADLSTVPTPARGRGGLLPAAWHALKRAPPTAWFGLTVITIYVLVALLAPKKGGGLAPRAAQPSV